MARATEVPITPSVLDWAIEQSGFKPDELAGAIKVDAATLKAWLAGDKKPTLSQARDLAQKLHRPFAAFLLPSPPQTRPLAVQFRQPLTNARELNPSERRYLRRSSRMQEILGWMIQELRIDPPKLPTASFENDRPEAVAGDARQLLRVSPVAQKDWASPSAAFDEWRVALERIGIMVFLFPMGRDSCRGFSLQDDYAPVIAVNTAWNESARIFTLFHEFGHLITHTSSACVETFRTSSSGDPVERWCERFAADVLLPVREVSATLSQYGWQPGRLFRSLDVAKRVASTYSVSLRAAVIRMIELNAATWELYETIPPISDNKRGGGGGTGRDRFQIKEDELGERASSVVVAAVEKEIFSRSQAVDLLDIPDVSFDELTKSGRLAR